MTLMERRRALMAQKVDDKHSLPSEYQRVEYVKNPSGGGAYFTTNITFGNPFKAHLVVQTDTPYTTYDRIIIGSRASSKNYNQVSINKSSNNYGFSGVFANLGNSIGLKTTIMAEYNSGHKIVTVQNSLGTFSDDVENSDNMWTSKAIAVFQTGQALAATQFRGGRIYELSVINPTTEDERLFLIPCYRKSDNKPGMYDTVSKTFYTSETSTDFEKGADV